MCQVNILQAKTELSKLILLLETDKEDEVIIARNGKPVAKLELYKKSSEKRIGIAKGLFVFNDAVFENLDAQIEQLFTGASI